MRRLAILILTLIPLWVLAQDKPYEFDKTVINVGKVKTFEIAKGVFTLTNKSNKPLIIKDAVGSCGCVRVYYSKKPIPPGQSTQITVTYRPYAPGKFKKGATIYFSLPGKYSKIFLTIKGTAYR